MTLFEAFLRLKNISFWDSKTSVFKAVCEMQKPWFAYVYIYTHVNQAFLSPATASKKLFLKLKKSFFWVSKTAFWRLLLESKKLDLHICMHANQGFCVSTDSLKNTCFWRSKRDVFKSQKSLKKNHFLAPC